MSYSLDDFDYYLPEERIAQTPAEPRDHARLLVYDRESGTIIDDHFYNLDRHLKPGTTLVANRSKVIKSRLLFNDGKTEIFIIRQIDDAKVEALVRPGRKFRKGRILELENGIRAEVLEVTDDGLRILRLDPATDNEAYDPFRATPFPPYLQQNEALAGHYQTVFARDPGSKAAPTAGLHFTESLLEKLQKQGYGWQEVTLHVGLGTFAPVKTECIEDHKMHSEWYQIDKECTGELNRASHITAVGTTSVRVLESCAGSGRRFRPQSGETDIFIKPGYRFRAVDSLITNFHLPKSTLLMLVAAFIGLEETHRIYRHAVESEYRFYSFGDGMLLL